MTEFAPPPGQGYDLQRTYAENKPDFWFRWADRWWRLPNMHMLDFDIQVDVMGFQGRVSEDNPDVNALKAMVNDLFDLIMDAGHEGQASDWRAVKPRPLPMLMDLLSQWSEQSGVDEGESSASTSSSPSTGRPSKRTSKPSTASGSARRSTARPREAGALPANS
ncbi:hypothetical protein FHR83_006717 [Actinoplanes campanulatus]|uniref:Uncharacterized protein n=1 Tax=Actinoplanes campanulatus TaxID=113559 RepID=A0A7W5FHU8_9ACTN|nr:hypothetical protein [Actinoplanes campanulatus]MBB3099011.1 hypothetical protein [Actinoplanes campanulatus]GGN39443.1 hypothetical protein GCM10010109_67390 [Actinoplanes campanulatus]GID40171.1 hypothetical protein Aca09nite_66770 [Actinoplanes campanulatus]